MKADGRITVNLSRKAQAAMERMMARSEDRTKTEAVNDALVRADFFEEMDKGDGIAIENGDGKMERIRLL